MSYSLTSSLTSSYMLQIIGYCMPYAKIIDHVSLYSLHFVIYLSNIGHACSRDLATHISSCKKDIRNPQASFYLVYLSYLHC